MESMEMAHQAYSSHLRVQTMISRQTNREPSLRNPLAPWGKWLLFGFLTPKHPFA